MNGKENVQAKYPKDVLYNACQIGNSVIHNFKFTDRKIQEVIQKENLEKIQISQGYSNCSIGVVDENSAIVTDKKIAKELEKVGIEVLLLENELSIKLLKSQNEKSKMQGLIGGAMTRIENKIMVFGELQKMDKENQILNFVQKRGLEMVDFKGLEVVDYGGVVVV